jgi:hypothetical protein
MLWSAAAAQMAPLQLSFAQSRRLVRETMRAWQRTTEPTVRQALWEQMLTDVAATRPPQRKKPRPNEPRAKRRVPDVFPVLRGTRAQARLHLQEQVMKN